MRVFPIILVALVVGVAQGFVPSYGQQSSYRTEGKREQKEVVLHLIPWVDVLVPSMLFVAAAAATVLKSDESVSFDTTFLSSIKSLSVANSKKNESINAIPSTVKNEASIEEPKDVVATPIVADIPEVVTKPVAETKSKIIVEKPKIDEVKKPIKTVASPPKPIPSTVSTSTLPPPVSRPEPARTSKDITQLKMEIANTLDQEKAKLSRLKAAEKRVQDEAAAVAATAAAAESEAAADYEFIEEFQEEEELVVSPKRGRKTRFVLKVIKKVIAPWRKWSNIQ
jgi:hypothetical protein